MCRRLRPMLCVSLLVTMASVAESQPLFSGDWKLVEESGDSNLSPLGQGGTIIQTPQTLTVTPNLITRRPSNFDGKSWTLRFDGADVTDTGVSASGDPILRVSKSQWLDSALLVITRHP